MVVALADELPELLAALEQSTARYATKPTPGAPNELGQILGTAKLLGRQLMPWQIEVARVASEKRVDDPRRYRYPIVVLTVPRQSGKTTLMRTVLAQRALKCRNRKAFYTAQTGKDATARWLDLVKDIEDGPLSQFVSKRIAAGSQALTFPTGSTISPFAPTAKSLHGYTPHDVMLDEIFAHDAAAGNDLMGAIRPAQLTLPDKQLWLVSTAGTADSGFLKSWVDQGRLAVKDSGAGIAYFEWSLADGLDPYDPQNWLFHPAVGHTITLEDLADDADSQSQGEWLRAYMNRWTSTSEAVIDVAKWDTLAGALVPVPWAQVTVAYEVAHDRSCAAIYACWKDPETGKPALKLVQQGSGAEWLAPAVAKIYVENRPKAIGADDGGPTKAVTDNLRRLPNARSGGNGVEVTTLTARDFATACVAYMGHVDDGTILHDGDPGHRAAVEAAATRPMGDSKVFSRRHSRGPIPELVAATVALRLHEQAPATAPQPAIYMGRGN
ncbi:terminase [Arthrobacter phage Maggie]|uniref:Terminase n=21 Tax=Decurrovirus decurro TaxID=1982105 RepID=A0A345M584_9CAUD|nr:terminase [Arthrobacter phage Jessica]ALF00848.1 terminase [Arthrobacter phage Sandman]ALJ97688.1 terminase [Arthrobacter phage TymAbreu]ALY09631.1 terminase [Arthrobacter phage Maggie]ALY09734.1 terminase [Arthrobacter phage Moloch]ALY10434.1 terminase [Arthrobacter phage Stratus]ANZ52271.1 terminase [Arthrobacter phage Courtney3]AOQ28338.1 terminase [Arthrobacter phage Massimo]AQT28382.1 terminase [Arthrobacter phage Chestnut]ASM62398.1 terminase [Arthrobacter phage TinoCrisci]ASR837